MNFVENIVKKIKEKGVEYGMIPIHRHSFTKHPTRLKKRKRKNEHEDTRNTKD